MKRILALLLFLPCLAAAAQNQQCLCTAANGVASDAYPPGSNQPTSCDLKRNGVVVGNFPVVPSSTIPLSNGGTCLPADGLYNPGVAGSVACYQTGALAVGTYTFVFVAKNGAATAADSLPLTIDCVAVLPTAPPPATNLRKR